MQFKSLVILGGFSVQHPNNPKAIKDWVTKMLPLICLALITSASIVDAKDLSERIELPSIGDFEEDKVFFFVLAKYKYYDCELPVCRKCIDDAPSVFG